MVSKIRLMLEYNTYCIWLYNENDEIVGNDNPPELKDDKELTDAFMAVSDLYDTFFIDNEYEFSYAGCPDEETRRLLKRLIVNAIEILNRKTDGKYPVQDDIDYDF